jgi:phosphoribosylamine-glycine ligase
MKASAKIDQQTAIQEEVKFSYSDKRPIPVKLYSDKNPVGAIEMPISHFCDKEGQSRNLWILKPVGLNRGQGIHVVDSIKKCKKLIKEYCQGKENPQA